MNCPAPNGRVGGPCLDDKRYVPGNEAPPGRRLSTTARCEIPVIRRAYDDQIRNILWEPSVAHCILLEIMKPRSGGSYVPTPYRAPRGVKGSALPFPANPARQGDRQQNGSRLRLSRYLNISVASWRCSRKANHPSTRRREARGADRKPDGLAVIEQDAAGRMRSAAAAARALQFRSSPHSKARSPTSARLPWAPTII